MTLNSNRLQFEVFGTTGVAYPGHPTAIAHLIMRAYPSYAEATFRLRQDSSFAAVGSANIPGSSDNIVAALELLKRMATEGVDDALRYGDGFWKNVSCNGRYAERQAVGQLQADAVKNQIRVQVVSWTHFAPNEEDVDAETDADADVAVA